MHTLADLGPAKLLEAEQEQIREIADELFFCEDAGAVAVVDAARRSRELVERLVESGRWTEERGAELVRDLEACGPASLVA